MILQNSIALGGSPAPAAYQIERSLRFNSADSASLTWAPPQAGNRTTWTWSGWVKRGSLSTFQNLFTQTTSAGTANFTDYTGLFFDTDNTLVLNQNGAAGSSVGRVISSAVFRDVSAWYHIVAVWDTGNATAADRLRLYVNGVRLTVTTTTAALNLNSFINTAALTRIGLYPANVNYPFDGYLAEVNFIDGQALTPSDFGETSSSTGVWIPKAYTGSYGQNGFYLPFNDNSTVLNLGRNRQTLTADPYFPYTTLLLNGNGTNGAQNNTFLDSSTNNFTITRNGNTTQGTFSPFSQTGWGNYFGGDGNYITAPYNAAFDYGTGDFSVECFAYIVDAGRSADSSKYGTLISGGLTSSNTNLWNLYFLITSGVISSIAFDNGGATILTASSQSISINAWHHFVLCRTGTTLSIFVDGNRIATTTYSSAVNTNSSGNVQISRSAFGSIYQNWSSGYFSNVRIVKGTQPYNAALSTITVPTAALTAITNTSLLTCQSNRFIDNSSNAFAITVNGTPSVQAFSPFAPTAAYSAATNGGSGYFDGTGDYLTVANNAAFALPGDYTIEMWVYPITTTGSLFGIGDYRATNNGMSLYYNANKLELFVNNAAVLTGASTVIRNQWNHIALVRSGSSTNNTKLYLNGVQDAQATNNTSFTGVAGNGLSIDNDYGGSYGATSTNCYISGLRLLKGTAQYTTAFTPPTAPPTAITNTSLLANFTNAGITDATGDNVLETVGNAQISTTQSKWGGSSLYFDGTGDRLLGPSSQNTAFRTGDFTIEFWAYPTSSTSTFRSFIDTRSGSVNTGISIWQNGTSLEIYGSAQQLAATSAITVNTWQHIAVTRASNTVRAFVNGIQVGSSYTNSNDMTDTRLVIADDNTSTYPFVGYLDDFRITKGLARYTGNFTVPAAQFAYNTADINVKQWAPNNFSVTAGAGNDSLVDSPTNYGTDTGAGGEVRGNYATWNPLAKDDGTTLTNGNLDLSSTNYGNNTATFFLTSGKWYWEGQGTGYVGAICGNSGINWSTSISNTGSNSIGWWEGGPVYWDGGNNGGSTTFTSTDVVGVALDMNAGVVYFYKNGTLVYTITFGSGTVPNLSAGVFPCFNNGISSGTTKSVSTNFGQRPFAYTAPSGFKALCTQNLPTPAIGASASTLASKNFNVITYTGDGTSSRNITGVGFAPDFVWFKNRASATFGHRLYDIIRGATKELFSHSTSAEYTEVAGLTAFGSDGYTVGNQGGVNENTSGFVTWNWKANGAGVSNTAGSITSTVSANQTAGISIVSYTANGVNGATVGHGLGVAPRMIIVKRRNGVDGWPIYHASLGATQYVQLESTAAAATSSAPWNNTAPTSSVFTIGTGSAINTNGATEIVYCFAEIAGFSRFGSYTGNGSTDGPFVYCGFRPRWLLIKSSTDSSGPWILIDTARNPYNANGDLLKANASDAEAAYTGYIDILSNGFKLRNNIAGSWTNTSGATYIFAAFAETPFQYSRAR